MAIPARRHFADQPQTQLLASSISNVSPSCTIQGSAFTGWPTSFPFFGTLEKQTANEEHVLVTAITGQTATITRGQGNTTAVAHNPGATFDHMFIAQDADEANAHTSATSGVHGVTGLVVGTAATGTNFVIQSGSFAFTITSGTNATSGTLTYPTAYNTAPIIASTLVVGSNFDLLVNWAGTPTATSAAWRVFTKTGSNVGSNESGSVHWIAIGT